MLPSSPRLSPVLCALSCLATGLASHPAHAEATAPSPTQAVREQVAERAPRLLDQIEVEAAGEGAIVLRGEVPTLRHRWWVEEVAERAAQGQTVRSELSVETEPRPDSAIAADVRAALTTEGSIEHLPIAVSVEDGTVVLAGEVQLAPQSRLARWIAGGVRGVRQVVDTLTLAPITRPDSVIQTELQAHYLASGLFSGEVLVQVEDGVVHLLGEVSSERQRIWAAQDAWVPGVRAVVSQGLRVEPDRFGADPLPPPEDDEAIRRLVLDAIAFDPRVHAIDIDASVSDGRVQLSGTVDTLKEKLTAEHLARHTPGVREVTNRLALAPAPAALEDEIATVIEAKFRRSALLGGNHDVEVRVAGSQVTLEGMVPTTAARWEAEDLAARTPGVHAIENRLAVAATLPADPGTTGEPAYSSREFARGADDRSLQAAVERALDEAAVVDPAAVEVSTLHGVVTLTGQVESWLARQVAEDYAYAAGARLVRNRLNAAPAE